MKGPRGDHGGDAASTKKSTKKSGYKRVTSVMSSMKKFVVKKVYGTGDVKVTTGKSETNPAQDLQEVGEVSDKEAEAAGVPTTDQQQKNLRKFASFED